MHISLSVSPFVNSGAGAMAPAGRERREPMGRRDGPASVRIQYFAEMGILENADGICYNASRQK